MSDYRKLSSDEIINTTTANCCANALRDCAQKLARRLKGSGLENNLAQAADLVAAVVEFIIEGAPDPDQRTMILRRMGSLQLQFGHTRKHPEDVVIMSMPDAQTLLAPLFDHCDMECPFDAIAEDGSRVCDRAAVKACEVRKALVRIGVSENGLGGECKYQFLMGKKEETKK